MVLLSCSPTTCAQGCFDDDDNPKPFKPWSPDGMREEWIRREYYVLSRQLLDPKPTLVFGTAK